MLIQYNNIFTKFDYYIFIETFDGHGSVLENNSVLEAGKIVITLNKI